MTTERTYAAQLDAAELVATGGVCVSRLVSDNVVTSSAAVSVPAVGDS